MTYVEITLPEDMKFTSRDAVSFATRIVSEACQHHSVDYNIKTNDGTYVDLKSIMGVMTLNYHSGSVVTIQVISDDVQVEAYEAEHIRKYIKSILPDYR